MNQANLEPTWNGVFMNLDRAIERRRHMERQLAILGVADRYARYASVDGISLQRQTSRRSAGEIGIFRSNLDVLERARDSGRAVHIMEDDVVLCDLTIPAIDFAVSGALLDEYDVVFTEMYVSRSVPILKTLHKLYRQALAQGGGSIERLDQIRVIDAREIYLFGSTSYLVGPRNIDRVLQVLHREWDRGPSMPLDTTIQRAARAKQLRLGCFFPFLSTVHLELNQSSDAGREESPDDSLVQSILRYAFFAKRDIEGVALPLLSRVLARNDRAKGDAIFELFAGVMRYHLRNELERE